MNQFVFEKKQKTVLIGAMILGVLCLFGSLIGDDELHTRFWTNYLHNTVFFTGIAFISLFILAAFTTAWAGWHANVKRIWEAFSLFMTPGAIMLLVVVLGVLFGFNHLYHWADAEAVAEDPILKGKASFLNPIMYTLFTVVVMGTFIFFARKIREISLTEDEEGQGLADNFKHHRRLRVWSAAFLPFAGFFSAAAIWQWIMSLDAHWYSTLFAWYTAASWFVAAMALTVMVLIYLKGKGYLSQVSADHFHDIGKYLFGISIFWTYLWFSQFMLIWYANVGEETIYFAERMENYPVLFYANLVLNFLLPFFILMRNDNKRKYGTMFTASFLVFFGHWLDFFLMIKPGARHTAIETIAHMHGADHAAEAGEHAVGFAMGFTIPGLLEIGIMIGFLAGFLYFVFSRLAKAPLRPKNDPFLIEAEHHHVWPYVD
ncbi:MAG TPA: hypothetical protein VJ953_01445 [Saprospiraceae bacterium]|nr:hypothetical protein [Saprospiraceae bacterium]